MPASQSTNGAAGFVACWSVIHIGAWNKTEWEMQRYGIDFYSQLAKRTTDDTGFASCGIAYTYLTPSGWSSVQKKIRTARELGTTIEVLTEERAKEVTPFLEFKELAGIAFDPDAIRVRAGDAIRSVAKELEKDGVQFRFNTHVTKLLRDGDKIAGVRLADGEIRSPRVIVAAGAWSRPLLAKLNIECPATPFNETRYVTKPLPGLSPAMPLLIFTDHMGHYIREEQGGLLIGGGDDRPHPADRHVDASNPPWCNKLPNDQAYRVEKHVKDLGRVMPILGQAEIGSIRSGIPTTTRDRQFIAGPVPGIGGLFVMTGCQEAGVTHGPALGRILAEYAIDGKTTWDTTAYRLERFAKS
jgi:glycine/D-amino acid oxidase-like deaminating enzyme